MVIESDFLVFEWQNVGCGQSDGLRFLDGSRVRRLVFVCGFDLVLDFVEGLLFFDGFDLFGTTWAKNPQFGKSS